MKKKNARYLLLFVASLLLLAMSVTLFSACRKKKTDDPVSDDTPGAEAGVYYYADKYDEYTVTLSAGHKFSYVIYGDAKSGTYALDGETLTLTIDGGEESLGATLKDDILTLNYRDAEMRFLKKKNFTVSFDSVGGSDVPALTVLNGRAATKPADPVKDGYVFLGWYTDDSFSHPYSFDAALVTGDITLYARWVEKPVGRTEYTIRFDLGYEAEAPADLQTIGGKLYNVTVPAREGYTFKGWWYSMSDKAEELTYAFKETDTVFTSDSTLFAVWEAADSAAAPMVNVQPNVLTWESVSGAAAYVVKITAPDGTVTVDNQRTPGTTLSVTFDAAGAYRVEVTAVNNGNEAVSETTVRYYINKGLDRVSGVTVLEPAVLVFQGVENAEKYLITVDCGNKGHKHTAFDNGNSLYFNFANCEMQPGGIVFTVTAMANGYASSETTFVYERNLAPVQGLFADNDRVTWDAVPGATSYLVKVGDSEFTVSACSFSLKLFNASTYTVAVTPVAQGYNLPDPTYITYAKTTIAAPANIRVNGSTVLWDAVEGATSYEVEVGSATATVTTNSCDISGILTWEEGSDYTLKVKAIGAASSATSDAVTVRYNAMDPVLSYSAGVLTWKHVVGAIGYEVQIEDSEIYSVKDGRNFFEIASFAHAGSNTVRVRFLIPNYTSNWAELTVYAHSVTLDSRGGGKVSTVYKAVGDPIVLPTTQKEGYIFADWYNTPMGPASNGAAYRDRIFVSPGELVLYAYYSPKPFTVQYMDGDTVIGDTTVYYGEPYVFMVPKPSVGTRAFGGWFSAPYGGGLTYTDANGVSVGRWSSLEDNTKVYAFWIDSVLKFTRVNSGYAVSKGDRINLVTSVTIPEKYNGSSVTELGAFNGCANLVEINIPDTLTRVATETTFEGCISLEAVNVYAVAGNHTIRYSSSDGVLYDSGDLANPYTAPRPAFTPAAKTGSYRVPDGVAVIPRRAFAQSGITSIIIPASVTEIGIEAFAECPNLETIRFEQPGIGVRALPLSIYERAFMECNMLTSVTLPSRLDYITTERYYEPDGFDFPSDCSPYATDAFLNCENLAELIIVGSASGKYTSANGMLLTDGGRTVIYNPVKNEVTQETMFPAGVTKIGNGAFYKCWYMPENIEIPGSIVEIGAYAFAGCSDIESLTFKERLANVTVGNMAFANCSYIESVTYEERSNVVSLGNGAFYRCRLSDIVIPSSMVSIGDNAFRMCEMLEYDSWWGWNYTEIDSITIEEGNGPLSFGDSVFYGCEVDTLKLPKNVTALPNFFTGMKVSTIEVDKDNPTFLSENGVIYSKKNEVADILLLYPNDKKDKSFTVPSTVTGIAAGAFKGNTNVEEIDLPASLTSIGREAFSGSVLKTVTFTPGGTDSLAVEAYAFYDCDKLTSLIFPRRTGRIAEYALANMENLAEVDLGGIQVVNSHLLDKEKNSWYTWDPNNVCKVIIPSTVTHINEYAFGGSYVSEIVFENGSKLEYIGAHAFEYCRFASFKLPATVKEVGAYAFASNDQLAEFLFEDGDVDLIFGTPYVYNAATGTIQYGNIFDYCSKLTEVNFPGRLTVLGEEVFERNSYVTKVTFGKDANDPNDTRLPSRLTTIEKNAFLYSDVETLIIPNTVRNTNRGIGIGDSAFEGCELTSVVFLPGGDKNSAPLTIGENAFASTKLVTITFPSRLTSYTKGDGTVLPPFNSATIFGGSIGAVTTLKEINFEEGGDYVSKDGVVYTKGFTELVKCPIAKSGKVIIPKTVTKIHAGAFAGCSALADVSFESGSQCTSIGEDAFYDCSFTSFVMPDGVVEVGADAFMSCAKLTSLTLSASLTTFDYRWINNCNVLRDIQVSPNSRTFKSIDGVLYSADGTKLICYLSTRQEESFKVPDGVVTIGERAFNSNEFLKKVILPASLELVDEGAFQRCSSLNSVTFAAGSKKMLVIGRYAFMSTALVDVALPERTASVAASGFANTPLRSVSFGDNSELIFLGDSAFSNTKLTMVTLPKRLVTIADDLFRGCTDLTTVTFQEGFTTMGSDTFRNCTALKTVNFPSTLEIMGSDTFNGCSSLVTATFAPGCRLQVLPNSTFRGCVSLEYIEIPANVLELTLASSAGVSGESEPLFSGCKKLKSVTFEEGSKCTRIGKQTFAGTALEQFTIPSSVYFIGTNAFMGTNLTSIVIPKTVTYLESYIFQGCESLTSVRVESGGLLFLPYGMFRNCSALESFTVPASILRFDEKLGDDEEVSIFEGCTSLSYVDVEPDSTAFRSKDGVLYNADWTVHFFPLPKTDYMIPVEVTTLTPKFFSENGIQSVTLQEGHPLYELEDGVLYTDKKSKFLFIDSTKTSFVIPANMTDPEVIAALRDCMYISEITAEEGNTAFHVVYNSVYDLDWNLLVFAPAAETFVIPKDVTTLPKEFFADTSVKKVIYEDGGTAKFELYSSGYSGGVFQYCEMLETVELPPRTTLIEGYTFGNCPNLKEVKLPNTIIKMDRYSFSGCSNLVAINVVAGGQYYISVGGVVYAISGEEGNQTYSQHIAPNGLEEYVIPHFITSVPTFSRWNYTNLKRITFEKDDQGNEVPGDTLTFANEAFMGMEALESVELPSRVKALSYGLFRGCPNLKEIHIPASLESIPDTNGRDYYMPFMNCPALKKIIIDEANTVFSVDEMGILWRKNGDGRALVMIPESVTFESYEIPSNVNFIPGAAFYRTGVKTITVAAGGNVKLELGYGNSYNINDGRVGASSEYINAGAFVCPTLESVTLNRVEALGQYAFYECDALTTVVLPDGLKKIDKYAFGYCSALESITLPTGLELIGDYAFASTGLKSIVLPDSVKTVVMGTDKNGNPEEVIVGKDMFYRCRSLVSVKLPATLEKIPEYMFGGCSALKDIELPATLKVIGNSAFNSCSSLESITLPDGLTTIGDYAFSYCTALKTIFIPASVTTVGESAFSSWTDAQTIQVTFSESEDGTWPTGWDKDWSYRCNADVKYDCKRDA